MTVRRILVIVALGVLVGAGWAAIGHSAWAAGLDAGALEQWPFVDAGVQDAGVRDAGGEDAGAPDAG